MDTPFFIYGGDHIPPRMYRYVLNLQGDVTEILDMNHAVVAEYEYDPWGGTN